MARRCAAVMPSRSHSLALACPTARRQASRTRAEKSCSRRRGDNSLVRAARPGACRSGTRSRPPPRRSAGPPRRRDRPRRSRRRFGTAAMSSDSTSQPASRRVPAATGRPVSRSRAATLVTNPAAQVDEVLDLGSRRAPHEQWDRLRRGTVLVAHRDDLFRHRDLDAKVAREIDDGPAGLHALGDRVEPG